jgi:hypothetical protein
MFLESLADYKCLSLKSYWTNFLFSMHELRSRFLVIPTKMVKTLDMNSTEMVTAKPHSRR